MTQNNESMLQTFLKIQFTEVKLSIHNQFSTGMVTYFIINQQLIFFSLSKIPYPITLSLQQREGEKDDERPEKNFGLL